MVRYAHIAHQATLSWEDNCCVVVTGGSKLTIVQSPGAEVQQTAGACAEPLTGKQARKDVAQGCHCCVAACTDAQTDVAQCGAASSADARINSKLVPESIMED